MQRPDILLHLDSYPEETSTAAIDQAVAFGASLNGLVTALAVHIDIRVPRNKVADYLVGLSRLEAEEEGKSLQACKRVLAHFSARAKEFSMPGDTLLERANLYLVGEHVAQRARTRDLCMVPVAGRLDGQRSVAEAVIFDSGRPTVVFWPGVANLPQAGLNTVVLAWDGSRCAARAMADAMPVLLKAKKVLVFTALREKPEAVAGLGADAVRHLQAHGVAAVAEQKDADRQPIGRVLDDYVRDVDADMLVMGAYGRSRMREFILGGATEHVLNDPKVPLFLSH